MSCVEGQLSEPCSVHMHRKVTFHGCPWKIAACQWEARTRWAPCRLTGRASWTSLMRLRLFQTSATIGPASVGRVRLRAIWKINAHTHMYTHLCLHTARTWQNSWAKASPHAWLLRLTGTLNDRSPGRRAKKNTVRKWRASDGLNKHCSPSRHAE